jgi:arginase
MNHVDITLLDNYKQEFEKMYEDVLITNISQGANHSGLKQNYCELLNFNHNFKMSVFIKEITSDRIYKNNFRHWQDVFDTLEIIYQQAANMLLHQKRLVTIGGDHSLSVATICARSVYSDNPGIIWIDSHADINTMLSTVTGNIHGMPLSFLLGDGGISIGKKYTCLSPEQLVYIGLRDIEPQEEAIIHRKGIKYWSYSKLISTGIDQVLQEVSDYFKIRNITDIHVSFDLDVMDFQLIPGVTVPVYDGGITFAAAYQMLEFILSTFRVSSFDIVEYNPYYDVNHKTLKFVNELLDFIWPKLVDIDIKKMIPFDKNRQYYA